METIDELKKNFVQYVNEQSNAFAEGNGKKANRFHKKIQDLYLKVSTLYGSEEFEEFLYSENENVKLWASCFCMEIYPDKSRQNLQDLLKSSEPIISLAAKMKLESGRFNF